MNCTVDELCAWFKYDPVTGMMKNRVSRGAAKKGRVSGTRTDTGYLKVCVRRKVYRVHHVAWAIVHGEFPPPGKQIDHINGVRDDNRIVNLRLVDQQGNSRNSAISSLNTSGVTGVLWLKREKLWRAEIKISGKRLELGYFRNKSDAVKARKEAEQYYGFHKNHGRDLIR